MEAGTALGFGGVATRTRSDRIASGRQTIVGSGSNPTMFPRYQVGLESSAAALD